MPIRYRRARPPDVQRAWNLVQSDKGLFSAQTWSRLPKLLADLVEREKITLCVFEDLDAKQFVCMGGYGFIHPAFLVEALRNPTQGVLEQAFAAELELRPAWLNQREVAQANRLGTLEAVSFFATPDFDDPNCSVLIGMIFDAFPFFLKGFQFRAIWQENVSSRAAEALVHAGYTRYRQVEKKSGDPITLLRASAQYGAPLGSFMASVVTSPPTRFQFTRAEQKLLECALLDFSDREVMEDLLLSAEAIKKRWRSIYAKVTAQEPALFKADVSGADRRRILLQRIRQNLQEIRPYSR
jgi:hypothetical protein